MPMTKEERHAKIHAEAMRAYDAAYDTEGPERAQCLEDRRFVFVPGAQWEGALGEQFANRPQFEVNKTMLAVMRVVSEYRNNRITVDFVPRGGAEYDTLADTCDGLYRADEQDSTADEAYDTAFEEAVAGGFGAWRLRAAYEDDEDDEDERQRIRFEPITDADNRVYFGPSKRQDKADAPWCIVLNPHTPDAYRDEFNDDPASWPKESTGYSFDWATPDTVWVAEYYRVEMKRETVNVFRGLDGSEARYTDTELRDDPELERELLATGFRIVRQKKVQRRRIHKYLLSGGGVLSDEGLIAGKHIPIVPMYGKRQTVDNVERYQGVVRLAKDPQRLKNMQISKLGELSGKSSVEKPIFTPDQTAGHAQMWADDNVKDYPYLLLNPITDMNGQTMPAAALGYTKPPAVPPAMTALLQITESDMQEVLGNGQAGEELKANVSGEAIALVQGKTDMQAFIYISQFRKALIRCGQIWLSMAQELYVEEGRKMKTVGAEGEIGEVEIMRPVANEDGEVEYEADLAEAKFDVAVEVGPSSTSKREATVKRLTSLLAITTDPETAQILTAMIVMNSEGEGISDIRKHFRRKLLRMGAVQPTDAEKEELAAEQAGQGPSANDKYLMAAAEEATANAAAARANTLLRVAQAGKAEADTENARAKTAETMASLDAAELQNILQAAALIQRLGLGGPAMPAAEAVQAAPVALPEAAQPAAPAPAPAPAVPGMGGGAAMTGAPLPPGLA